MENFKATLLVATILVFIALVLLAISFFITGKLRIKPGACGKVPNKKKDEACGNQSTCELCKKPDTDENKG